MDISIIKRKIKSKLTKNNEGSSSKRIAKKPSFLVLSVGVSFVVLMAFCLTQLTVVSFLSPRGKELKRLDSEKEILLEENRKLEQEIAEYTSLPLIKNRAQSQLNMQRPEDVIYISSPATTAEIPY